MKFCYSCKEEKTVDEFNKNRTKKDGLATECKSCSRKARSKNKSRRDKIAKQWYEKNKDRVIRRNREAWLKKKFGITQDQYQELLDKQNQRCAICSKHQSSFKKKLHIDHSHKTGRIRGLLCWSCNLKLIGKHNDPELFRKAAQYLEGGTDWIVPPRPKRKRKKRKVKK